MRRQKVKNQEVDNSGFEKILEGKYANYFMVGHNAFEFVLDFGQYYTGNKNAALYTRVVTNPCCAKELLETLRISIEEYEKSFGLIKGIRKHSL